MTEVKQEEKRPDTMSFGDLRALAADWDMTHQVCEFQDTGSEPENKIFFGLPYRDVGVVAGSVGVPAAFAKRVDNVLLKRNLDYMAGEKKIVDQAQAVVANGEIVEVMWNKGAELIPASTVVELIQKSVGQDAVVGRHTLWPDNGGSDFWVEIVFPNAEFKAGDNDVLQAGITVEHNIGGSAATSVEAFIYRLICQNGLIAKERGAGWSINHREFEKALPTRLQYLAPYTMDAIQRLIGSKGAPIADPVASALGLAKELKVPKKARDAFMSLATIRRPDNWYDLVQCLTEAANGVKADLYRKTVTAAGSVMASLPRLCGSCYQVVH